MPRCKSPVTKYQQLDFAFCIFNAFSPALSTFGITPAVFSFDWELKDSWRISLKTYSTVLIFSKVTYYHFVTYLILMKITKAISFQYSRDKGDKKLWIFLHCNTLFYFMVYKIFFWIFNDCRKYFVKKCINAGKWSAKINCFLFFRSFLSPLITKLIKKQN